MDFMEEKMKIIANETLRYKGVSYTIGNEIDVPEDIALTWIRQKKASKKSEEPNTVNTAKSTFGNDRNNKSTGSIKGKSNSGKNGQKKKDNKSGEQTAAVTPGTNPEGSGGGE